MYYKYTVVAKRVKQGLFICLKHILYVSGKLGVVGAASSIICAQLIRGTGLSLVLTFVIAGLISHRFAVPISQLNEQARMLSGERFRKGFCRELDELYNSLTQSAEKAGFFYFPYRGPTS